MSVSEIQHIHYVFGLNSWSVLTDAGGCGCHGSVVEMADRWVKVAHWLQTAFTILLDQSTHGWKVVVQWTSKITTMTGLHFLGHLYLTSNIDRARLRSYSKIIIFFLSALLSLLKRKQTKKPSKYLKILDN